MTALLLPDSVAAPSVWLTVDEAGTGAAEWDRFASRAPDARLVHLAAWQEVMRDALEHETIGLVARDRDGVTHGLMPLVCVRSALFGHYLVSMPFANHGGPIGTRAARAALARAALAEAKRRGVDLLELRGREPCDGLRTAPRKVTVVLDLPEDSQALWTRFPSKLRSQIRKPMSAGFDVRIGAAEREPFFEVYTRHMRDLGSPALGARVFDCLSRKCPAAVTFAAVYDGSRPVAAGCGFLWRDDFELVWAAALRDHARLAPNMLLYWSLIEHATRRGARRFDFGRCSRGSGTHRFKLQWGGSEIVLPWAQWSPRGMTEPPNPGQSRYRAAIGVWRRLPLAVTRVCGPHLSRVIP